MVFSLALYRQSRLLPTFSRPFRPVKAPLISSTTFRTALWTRFRKFTKSTSTNAMALCSAGRCPITSSYVITVSCGSLHLH